MREFLASNKIPMPEVTDSRKNPMKEKEARALFKTVGRLYAARGKKTVEYDLKKASPDTETMAKYFLGPTGNFRAPAIRAGRNLIIGFDEAALKKVFKTD